MSQKILVADTHILCRDALCAYITHANPSWSMDCADDWQELIEKYRQDKPDVVLIDQDFPLEEEVARYMRAALMIRHRHADVMAGHEYEGVIPKYFSSKEILAGLRELLAGRTFYPSLRPMPSTALVEDSVSKQGLDFNLTPRERDVLGYLVKGESNKAIARALDLQVVTVKLHVRGICRKLKAANRTQAALIARESGWR